MAGKLKHTTRVMASNERGNPLSIEDLEQFCRTARAQGVPATATLVATHPGGVGDCVVEIYADRYIQLAPALNAAFTDTPAVNVASVGTAGRYVGLAGDVPSVGTRGGQPAS